MSTNVPSTADAAALPLAPIPPLPQARPWADPRLREIATPDHTTLPDHDDEVENFFDLPQSMLLSECIRPVLQRLHPDGQFAIGANSGVYWNITDSPLEGCKAPDWYYVPGVDGAHVEGVRRRSYVLWRERVPPKIVIEFASGDGTEERDRTPGKGKFWVYEQGIGAQYYAIMLPDDGKVEVYASNGKQYVAVKPNERGHYPIAAMGVELGIWHGHYLDSTARWLRWYDAAGNMLPTGEELAAQIAQRAEQEKQRAEQEKQRAEQEKQRADTSADRAARLAERLRSLGVDPDSI